MAFGLILLVLGVALGLLVINHDSGEVFGLASGDFARLVALGTFGAVLAALLLRDFRGRFADALRTTVVWLALFVLLIVGYGFKGDIEAVGRRTVAVLLPGVAVETGERGSVMVAKSRDGHFRVRARVNGAPIRLIVDTGASSVVLTDYDARAAGIDTNALIYDVRVSTANGATTAAAAVIEALTIGEITEKRVTALVAKPGQLEGSLLGNSFLDRLASFTVQGDRLIFRQ